MEYPHGGGTTEESGDRARRRRGIHRTVLYFKWPKTKGKGEMTLFEGGIFRDFCGVSVYRCRCVSFLRVPSGRRDGMEMLSEGDTMWNLSCQVKPLLLQFASQIIIIAISNAIVSSHLLKKNTGRIFWSSFNEKSRFTKTKILKFFNFLK